MKKIAIMLLAALMLFAFVACDNTTEEPKASEVVSAITAEVDGVKPADYQSDVFIAEDGAVTGTFKYVEDNALFPEGEKNGYFLLVNIKLEKDQHYYVDSNKETGENELVKSDADLMLYIGKDKTEAAKRTATIYTCDEDKSNAEKLITLTFAKATFADPDTAADAE